MKLSIIDIDAFCKDLPEISSHKPFENCKISRTGIFSQQIFGPIQSYRCGCLRSYYRGPHSGEKKCMVCDVEITSSSERSRRFAKIILPFEVLNPLFYFLFTKAKPASKKVIDNMLTYKHKYYFDENDIIQKAPNDDSIKIEKSKLLVGLNGVKTYINKTCETLNKKELNYIKKYKDLVTVKNVIVIPPSFRNFTKKQNNSHSMDMLNKLYIELLTRSARVKNTPYKIDESDDVYRIYFKMIQTYVFNISNYIFDKLSSKTGLLRGNILGKRVDFSGRAVISPNPQLKLDECGVPYLIALEMFKPMLTVHLINKKIYNRYNIAAKEIDDAIAKKDYKFYKIVEDFCNGKLCILNRQPTLHRTSVLSFKIKVTECNTLMVHPLICNTYNSDFDGDSCKSLVLLYLHDIHRTSIPIRIEIEDFDKHFKVEKISEKTKDNGVIVENYKVLDEVYVDAIDNNTGNIAKKKITNWSIHKNLNMYKIERKAKVTQCSDIKDLWVSDNHSLVVFDKKDQLLKRLTPIEVLNNMSNYMFIRNANSNNFTYDLNENDIKTETCRTLLKKQNNKEIEFIPCEYLNIELDPTITTGYDFTIEDYYTFTTADGLFIYDSMAIYIGSTPEFEKDIKDKLSIWNNLISATNLSAVPVANQDIVLGVFTSTIE